MFYMLAIAMIMINYALSYVLAVIIKIIPALGGWPHPPSSVAHISPCAHSCPPPTFPPSPAPPPAKGPQEHIP